MSIIEGVSQEASKREGARVHLVHLQLGALSGVVKEALLFSFGLACEGTSLEGAELVIEEIPVTVYCPTCKEDKLLDSIQRFCCPACGSLTPEIINGRQLEIVAIEISEAVDDEAAAEGSQLARMAS